MRQVALVLSMLLLLAATPAADARMLFDTAGAAAEPRQMSRLPGWVQVALDSAPLYPSDASARPSLRLARHTFLRVLDGGAARLQVDVYDEAGATRRHGWIDADDVLPSAPGTDWLVAAHPTPLFPTADADAAARRHLGRFAALQRVAGPLHGRVQVRVYRSDFTVLDEGWVDQAHTGPALPPLAPVPALERGPDERGPLSALQPDVFLDATARAARAAAARTGVPASVTVAQAILESDWGRSGLAQNAHNYFGIKAVGRLGTDGVVWMPTAEYDADGELYETVSPFRAYRSLTDSITDHDRLLQTSSRYADAMRAANDPRAFAARLYEAGYSTDPEYADKLIALMDRYDLYRLDA